MASSRSVLATLGRLACLACLASLAALAGSCAPAPTAVRLVGAPAPSPSAQGSPEAPGPASPPPEALPAGTVWRESFAGGRLDWQAPLGQSPEVIGQIYRVERDEAAHGWFLRVTHDAGPDRSWALRRAAHLGKSFLDAPVPLSQVKSLRWRWRVLKHPAVGEDAWLDLGASLYVMTRQPGLFGGGKGLKLGWLAKPGPAGTRQEGIAQIALRSDPAGEAWRDEEVDLCSLYAQAYGSCDGPEDAIRYIGVLSDADNTRSVAQADYASFELLRR